MIQKQEVEACPEGLSLLDELISSHYERLKTALEESPPKLGDWLKMLEMRLKLTPTGAGHKRFWQMLEEIRKSTVDARTGKRGSKRSRPKRGGSKK